MNIKLKKETRKMKLLVGNKYNPYHVIFNPKNKSKDGEYVLFGDYYGDDLFGWFLIDKIKVFSVLEIMENEK